MEATKTKTYIAVVVDGSSDLRLCWPTIICDYLQKIIRYCSGKSTKEGGVRAQVELGLVFYQVQPDSGCQVQLSYWTGNLHGFLERLLHLTFNGIGGVDQSAMAVGLHNALAMFSEIPVGMPSEEHSVVEKHCILVTASNPFLLNTPDRISYTKHFGIQTDQSCTENLGKVERLLTELAVSLSVISPMQLPDSEEGIYLGNGISEAIDPSATCRGNVEYNVVISEHFKEAQTALSQQHTVSSSSGENVEPKAADIITTSSDSDIEIDKELEWLQANRSLYDELIEGLELTPRGSIHAGPAQNELGESSQFQEMGNEVAAVQTNTKFAEVELQSMFPGREEQRVAPQNQNDAEPREEKDEWADLIDNLCSERTDISSNNAVETCLGSIQPAVGHDIGNTKYYSNTASNLETLWKDAFMRSGIVGGTTSSGKGKDKGKAKDRGKGKATTSQFPPADREIMLPQRAPHKQPAGNFLSQENPNNEMLRLGSRGGNTVQNSAWRWGGINSGPSSQQKLIGTRRNLASAFGPQPPPAAEAMSSKLPRTTSYNRGVFQLPTIPMEEMTGYVKSWQGTIVGDHRGLVYFRCRAKAFRREAAPSWLTAMWPSCLVLGYVTPQSTLDKIGGNRSPIEFVILEMTDDYDEQIYENMKNKDLSIKISLPSQTLFLAPTNMKSRFIATVLHKNQDFPKLMPRIVSSFDEQPR